MLKILSGQMPKKNRLRLCPIGPPDVRPENDGQDNGICRIELNPAAICLEIVVFQAGICMSFTEVQSEMVIAWTLTRSGSRQWNRPENPSQSEPENLMDGFCYTTHRVKISGRTTHKRITDTCFESL
jgi:hypothetical protein